MELLRCLQDVQGQLGEMREFVEIQLSVQRDLLDRVVNYGFAAEHSVRVSAKFSKGPEAQALRTIQEDQDDDAETVGRLIPLRRLFPASPRMSQMSHQMLQNPAPMHRHSYSFKICKRGTYESPPKQSMPNFNSEIGAPA